MQGVDDGDKEAQSKAYVNLMKAVKTKTGLEFNTDAGFRPFDINGAKTAPTSVLLKFTHFLDATITPKQHNVR